MKRKNNKKLKHFFLRSGLSKTNSILIIYLILILFMSGCNQNNIWNHNSDDNSGDNGGVVLPDVTITSINAGAGKIDLAWTDPAGIEFDAIDITCTVTSTSAEFSTAEALPGDQAYTITGVTVDTEYTVAIIVTDSKGNSSAGISMYITPSATVVPGHLIYTAAELDAVRDNLGFTYYLMADIDLSGYSSGTGWVPIEDGGGNPFSGTFEGNNHTISNLTINEIDWDKGLFAYMSGTVKDLNLINVNISGGECAGALTANNQSGGSIENCSMSGTVDGAGVVGGLVGFNAGNITDSYASATVSGTGRIGILVGEHDVTGGLIIRCHSEGIADADTSSVGGLVGRNESEITKSYSTGNVYGGWAAGGLVGISSGATAIITHCHATGDVDGSYRLGGLVGWNEGGNVGDGTSEGGSYAEGDVDGSYQVGGLVGWNNVGTISYCHAIGEVTGTSMQIGGLVGYNNPTGSNIDNSYATGRVEGVGNTGGLVGENNEGKISSCNASGIVFGTDNTGGLAGYSQTTDGIGITDSRATGLTVTGTGSLVGGLVGMHWNGDIINSSASAVVSGVNNVGGLVGRHANDSLTRCYAIGDVSGNTSVGGLVGINESSVDICFSTGFVAGATYVGGLAGQHIGTIQNCYAKGAINATNYAGGLIGFCSGSDTSYCYATGEVTAVSNWGGLVGNPGSNTLEFCYYNYINTDNGGNSIGLITITYLADMIIPGTYSGWIFGATEIWSISGSINEGYPYLTNNSP